MNRAYLSCAQCGDSYYVGDEHRCAEPKGTLTMQFVNPDGRVACGCTADMTRVPVVDFESFRKMILEPMGHAIFEHIRKNQLLNI